MSKTATRDPLPGEWPVEDLEYLNHCPLCDSPERIRLYDNLRDKIFFSAPGTWALWQCRSCSVGYLDPRPTPSSIGRAYGGYYTHHAGQSEMIASKPWKAVIKRLKLGLKNDYLNARFDSALSPSVPGGRWLIQMIPKRRLQMVASFRNLTPPKAGFCRLLDIGSGNGDFVVLANSLGYQAEGLEIDPKARDFALMRGLVVHQGGLPDSGLASSSVDVITMNHVLEHLHDPVASLKEAFRLLRPGGKLWVQVPNLDGASNKLWGENSRLLEPPRHLLMFNVENLKQLFLRAGFKDVEQLPTPNIARFVYVQSYAASLNREPYEMNWQDLPDKFKKQAVKEEKLYSGISRFSDVITISGYKP